MGAVLSDSCCGWEANRPIVRLLREHLSRSHPIWGYIHVEGAQFGGRALSDRELATILAALRLWQRHGQTDADPSDDVASDSGRHKVLCSAEIDRLCERLNFGGESTAACDG